MSSQAVPYPIGNNFYHHPLTLTERINPMPTFKNSHMTDLVQELLEIIEYCNGMDSVRVADLLSLKRAVDAQCRKVAETTSSHEFISAKDYLSLPTDARVYCRNRREDYNKLAEHMVWHPEADGAERCAIYNLHIRRHPYDSETWGEITLPNGTLVVVKHKMQIMAYILAAYW